MLRAVARAIREQQRTVEDVKELYMRNALDQGTSRGI